MRNLLVESDLDNEHPTQKININKITEIFTSNNKTYYYHRMNLCIDELMMACRGKLQFCEYIKRKKHKCGIKIYELYKPIAFVIDLLIHSS